jgi:hypothetical protein
MHRLSIIKTLFEATCNVRRIAEPNLIIEPIFLSIYESNIVKVNRDINQSIVSNPEYIICFVGYRKRALNGSYDNMIDHSFIIDKVGNSIEGITSQNWIIYDIRLGTTDHVDSAKFAPNNLNSNEYEYTIVGRSTSDKLTPQDLWDMFTGIDGNCKTDREIDLYIKYFIEHKRLNNSELTLNQYKSNLALKDDVVAKYKDLMSNIENLVARNVTL